MPPGPIARQSNLRPRALICEGDTGVVGAIAFALGQADRFDRAIGEAFADQGFSIVDRTSFAVMLRLGIHQGATFTDDFAVYRFGSRRERAFEIQR